MTTQVELRDRRRRQQTRCVHLDQLARRAFCTPTCPGLLLDATADPARTTRVADRELTRTMRARRRRQPVSVTRLDVQRVALVRLLNSQALSFHREHAAFEKRG